MLTITLNFLLYFMQYIFTDSKPAKSDLKSESGNQKKKNVRQVAHNYFLQYNKGTMASLKTLKSGTSVDGLIIIWRRSQFVITKTFAK